MHNEERGEGEDGIRTFTRHTSCAGVGLRISLRCAKTKRGTPVPLFVLARRKGFEPPTFWFVAKHSIQLS